MLETLRAISARDITVFMLMCPAGEIPVAIICNSLALVSTLSGVTFLCNLGTQVPLMFGSVTLQGQSILCKERVGNACL